MSRSIVFVLLLVAIVSVYALPSGEKCGPNEEYVTCGSPCEPECNQKPRDVCILRCDIGCRCKSGFLRNANKECVLSQQC